MLKIVLWPFYLFLRWIYKKSLLQTLDGINICDIASLDDRQRRYFCSCVVKALELIKKHDAKRYCRVQRHLLYIINKPAKGAGFYDHMFRSCALNISFFDFEDSEDWKGIALACTIVHEATHGVLCARNITSYDEAHYLRVERTCHQEESRFARRVAPDFDMGGYDESWYQRHYWKNTWQHMIEALKTAFPSNGTGA